MKSKIGSQNPKLRKGVKVLSKIKYHKTILLHEITRSCASKGPSTRIQFRYNFLIIIVDVIVQVYQRIICRNCTALLHDLVLLMSVTSATNLLKQTLVFKVIWGHMFVKLKKSRLLNSCVFETAFFCIEVAIIIMRSF